MKTKHLNTILAVITATLIMTLFNNFSVFHKNMAREVAMESVNEASRVSHAKELLGHAYKGSLAQRLEGKDEINYLILSKIQAELSPRWKGHAQAIASTLITESSKYKFDPVFAMAIIKTESHFNPLTRGQFGEIGLMQIKPDTAKWIAKKYHIAWHGAKSLENPRTNIIIGMAYFSYLREKFDGRAQKYVTAYNMGPRNVRRLALAHVKPVEYAQRVMKNYAGFYSRMNAQDELVAVN